MLILISGLPGSGKTKIARELSKRLNLPILSTDEIRKKLFKKPKYTKFEKWLIYKVMFLVAEELLKNKIGLILDATFSGRSSRNWAKKIAKRYKTPFKIIEVRCQEKILLERIEKRIKEGSLSDADRKIYFKIKREFEPIKERHIIIDNSKSFRETKKQIEKISKDFWHNLKPV